MSESMKKRWEYNVTNRRMHGRTVKTSCVLWANEKMKEMQKEIKDLKETLYQSLGDGKVAYSKPTTKSEKHKRIGPKGKE